MARILVTNDDETTRVEVTWSDEIEGFIALCDCGENVAAGTHEQFSLDDTVQAAEIHADRHSTENGAPR